MQLTLKNNVEQAEVCLDVRLFIHKHYFITLIPFKIISSANYCTLWPGTHHTQNLKEIVEETLNLKIGMSDS